MCNSTLDMKDSICRELMKAKSIIDILGHCHTDQLDDETVTTLAQMLARILEELTKLIRQLEEIVERKQA